MEARSAVRGCRLQAGPSQFSLPGLPSTPVPASAPPTFLVGIDLAWGERNGDGLCLLAADARHVRVAESAHVFGDAALLGWLEARLPPAPAPALLLLDAPVVCPNETGSRPADRQTHTHFGRFHAGAHPANRARCVRPLRITELVCSRLGFAPGWEHPRTARLAVEVFPHPAAVRWLGLTRIVKYKRPPAATRRAEFARFQGLLRDGLPGRFPELEENAALHKLLAAPWTKPAEDQLDALLCALVGYQHWQHDGARSQVLGDLESGFIVVPAAD